MAKAHRGKGLWNLPDRGRGTCPICKRTRIKLLHTYTLPEGRTVKACRHCRNKRNAP